MVGQHYNFSSFYIVKRVNLSLLLNHCVKKRGGGHENYLKSLRWSFSDLTPNAQGKLDSSCQL